MIQQVYRALVACFVGCASVGSSPLAAQPPSCPRPALARLTPLIGEWTATWEYRVNGTLTSMADARATVAAATAGCSLIERLEGIREGKPVSVTTLIAAPGDSDTLQLSFVDSDHGELLNFVGTVHGDTLRFSWSRDFGSRTQLVRREYTEIRPNAFVVTTLMSPDTGRNWFVVSRVRHQRR